MPNATLSDALKEAYASAPTDVAIVDTLELRHPAFSAPIRVVADYVPINAKLEATAPLNAGEVVTFQPYPFNFALPEVIDSGIPELMITIDNVSREINSNIELAVTALDKLEVTYRAYLSDDLITHGPHNDPPLNLTIVSIEANALSIEARASIVDFVNRKFPSNTYDETRFPGLIAD